MNVRIDGFHGTDMKHVDSILRGGFIPSLGDNEWLGDGAYFFVRGINEDPVAQAEQWAIIDSWNNKTRKNEYDEYAVLHGVIEVDENNYLDLTEPSGIAILDYIQEKYTDKLAEIGKNLNFIDGCIINFARGEQIVDIRVVKGNFYIKLRKEDRVLHLLRRSPNCTICSVYSPKDNITNIDVVKKGRISYEIG